MNPLVSVIIPVHNGAHFLPDSLASVFAQEYRPIEVIVADDGSTDGSAEVAESFPGVRCLRLEKGGVSRARNLAVAASAGEWLAFLDADDRWFPRKLTEQVALGEACPEAGLVLCRVIHRFSVDIPEWFYGPTDGSAVTAYEPSAWLVRRAVFERVGGFDEARSLGEDTQWLSRAWDLGISHLVAEEIGLERHIHGANATGLIQNRRVVFDILRESVERKRARRAIR
ncbi:glycosyltransferase family A protein [Candidatus Amarobacter glycogenicus]|uniref:glycosyltransferase family 2 protein n=1 Tax=Candidatus Amarobacter glycogenicus TaxID=3140699 RepID=UPI00313706B0|nr:glycosyltransferase family 2 protein [Dehalococcoidia bacterium]